MEKKNVIVVWEYPQITDDPVAIVIDPKTGEKIESATLDCRNYRTGGNLLVPREDDSGGYVLRSGETDQFKKDNPEFTCLPKVEDRYLSTCWGRETIGVMYAAEEIFRKHFGQTYNIISIFKLRSL